MLDFTREIKKEYLKDVYRYDFTNNTQKRTKTYEQNLQACMDRRHFYINKWNKLLEQASTKAQKDYCNSMINHLLYHYYGARFYLSGEGAKFNYRY